MKEIILANNKGIALIDDEDFNHIKNYSWYETNGYAVTKITTGFKKPKQYSQNMHRLILNLPKYQYQVDHINGNKLDNRKINLRLCTTQLNAANRKVPKKWASDSKYKGVHFEKTMLRKKRWRARIEVNYKKIDLGMYHTQEDAALAYNLAASKYFGEFARLNIL